MSCDRSLLYIAREDLLARNGARPQTPVTGVTPVTTFHTGSCRVNNIFSASRFVSGRILYAANTSYISSPDGKDQLLAPDRVSPTLARDIWQEVV